MGRTPRTWALVADGTRARIVRGLEAGAPEPAPSTELISQNRSQHLRDIMSDRPGRTHSSDRSGRRSAMEYGSDPIRRDMQDFAREILERLDSHRRAGDFAQLAVFAPPDMLGILRAEAPAALRGTIVFDRPLHLVRLGEGELRALVRRELRDLGDGLSA